jgi:hypothetical protein
MTPSLLFIIYTLYYYHYIYIFLYFIIIIYNTFPSLLLYKFIIIITYTLYFYILVIIIICEVYVEKYFCRMSISNDLARFRCVVHDLKTLLKRFACRKVFLNINK